MSACIGTCELGLDGRCTGCGRTASQIEAAGIARANSARVSIVLSDGTEMGSLVVPTTNRGRYEIDVGGSKLTLTFGDPGASPIRLTMCTCKDGANLVGSMCPACGREIT